MLNIIDEFTREALMIRVGRKLSSLDVIDALTDLFILRGPPQFIRSDNGPEFVAKPVRDWIATIGANTAYIEPGSPWENGYCESFNAGLRDELLNGETSIPSPKPRPSSSNGGVTTTPSGRTAPSAGNRRRPIPSYR
jgi:transposase InsO family protein